MDFIMGAFRLVKQKCDLLVIIQLCILFICCSCWRNWGKGGGRAAGPQCPLGKNRCMGNVYLGNLSQQTNSFIWTVIYLSYYKAPFLSNIGNGGVEYTHIVWPVITNRDIKHPEIKCLDDSMQSSPPQIDRLINAAILWWKPRRAVLSSGDQDPRSRTLWSLAR